jgi:hypothetical protein
MAARTLTVAEIFVKRVGPGEFAVEVVEGSDTTAHRVTMPSTFIGHGSLFGKFVGAEAVVEESFRFLLEREPASAILPEFDLPDISTYFPDYFDELRRRLT